MTRLLRKMVSVHIYRTDRINVITLMLKQNHSLDLGENRIRNVFVS
jgi:hypothetical protein